MSSHWYLKSISVKSWGSTRETKWKRIHESSEKKLNQLQPFSSILSSAVCECEAYEFCKFINVHMLAFRMHTHIVRSINANNNNNRLGTWAIRNSISPVVGNISTPPHIGNKNNKKRAKRQTLGAHERVSLLLHWNEPSNQRVVLAFLNICNEQKCSFFSIRHFFCCSQQSACLCLSVGAVYPVIHLHTRRGLPITHPYQITWATMNSKLCRLHRGAGTCGPTWLPCRQY